MKERTTKAKPAKSTRRNFVKAAVAAPLVAGLAAEAQGEPNYNRCNLPTKPRGRKAPKAKEQTCQNDKSVPSTPARAVVYIATVENLAGRRVALASLNRHEVESYCESFNRMCSDVAFAEVHQRLFDLSLAPIPIYFAVCDKPSGEREIVSASLRSDCPTVFAETYNSIGPDNPRMGNASVVMGTAFLDEAVEGGQV